MRGLTLISILFCLNRPAWSNDCDCLDGLLVGVTELEDNLQELTASIKFYNTERQDLAQRLDQLEGQTCASFYEFQCGFPLPQCIAHYLVCDGEPDCQNGQDEKNCDVTLPAKAYWVATEKDIPFYSCLDGKMKATTARSTLSISEDPLAASMPMVNNVNLETYNDGSTYMWRDAGFYSYAYRAFVFWGPTWPGFCTGYLDKRNDKQMVVHCANGQDPTDYEACCRYNYQLVETLE